VRPQMRPVIHLANFTRLCPLVEGVFEHHLAAAQGATALTWLAKAVLQEPKKTRRSGSRFS